MKFFKVALLSVMLSLGLSASDFLSKATNGALSEDLAGVKQLNSNEMLEVLGGYAFARYQPFDFYGRIPSFAFLVGSDDGYIMPINDEFGLPYNQILVAKTRVVNSQREVYLQIYSLETRQKVRDYLNDRKGDAVLNDFRRYLRENYRL